MNKIRKVKDPNKLEENPVYMTQYIVHTYSVITVRNCIASLILSLMTILH